MKAIIWTKYGPADGLQLQEIEKPVPKDDEILVKVHATTVTAGDSEMRRLRLPLMLSFPMRVYAGLWKPKRITILGQELAGEVEQVGRDVSSFKPGDPVFGTTGFKFGAYAEYICLPGAQKDAQGTIAAKPKNLSYAEAAAVPTAAFEALHYMNKADVQPGQKVLVVGGGGSIGSYSIQLAKNHGAEVTAVDSSEKQDMIRAAGADIVIDYTRQGYTQAGESYDVIIDVVGRKLVRNRLELLKPGGYYFLAFTTPWDSLLSKRVSRKANKNLVIQSSEQSREDLLTLKELIEAGKLKPIIDKRYPLAEVPAAHRYHDSGQKKGNIVITLD
jgi:2-desacetyl-2-hydroxyethyl bacteriochlorophyllide A dehydrogenase